MFRQQFFQQSHLVLLAPENKSALKQNMPNDVLWQMHHNPQIANALGCGPDKKVYVWLLHHKYSELL